MVAAMIAAALTAVVAPGLDAPPVAAAECADAPTAAALDAFFAADGAGGLSGADYPHAIDLPDGRTLWLFQDAFVGDDGRLWQDGFAHNVALVQSGTCFQLLPTSGGPGTSWIGSWVEEQLGHWFWPLDAEVGRDGHLWVFLADVRNPNGTGAASGAVPAGTWRARFRLPDLELIDLEQAADSSSSLFGYSIVSDDDWTYLYGHCYRQFSPEYELGFEPACSPHAYLARVPKGRLDRPPSYWSGDGWTLERADRAPVLTGTVSMPVSVERFGDVYVAASDEGDWFGADVVVRTAARARGPVDGSAALHARDPLRPGVQQLRRVRAAAPRGRPSGHRPLEQRVGHGGLRVRRRLAVPHRRRGRGRPRHPAASTTPADDRCCGGCEP